MSVRAYLALLCIGFTAGLPSLLIPTGGSVALHTQGGDVAIAWGGCGSHVVLGSVVVDTGIRSGVCQ